MRKLLLFIVFIFALSSCGESTTTVSETPDRNTILKTWETKMSPMEQALICNLYWTEPYEELIDFMTTGEDALSAETAALTYQVMNEEC